MQISCCLLSIRASIRMCGTNPHYSLVDSHYRSTFSSFWHKKIDYVINKQSWKNIFSVYCFLLYCTESCTYFRVCKEFCVLISRLPFCDLLLHVFKISSLWLFSIFMVGIQKNSILLHIENLSMSLIITVLIFVLHPYC